MILANKSAAASYSPLMILHQLQQFIYPLVAFKFAMLNRQISQIHLKVHNCMYPGKKQRKEFTDSGDEGHFNKMLQPNNLQRPEGFA